MFGGQPGATGATLLVRDGTTEPLGSKDVLDLREGDLLSFRLAGAGGYGDPRERDRESVRRDVADGLVSPEAARTIYGLDSGARD